MEGINLSSFRTHENPNQPGYNNHYNDNNGKHNGSVGYDTLDAPPHYDFYANTAVWGRRRRFRPSLYQLRANPEVSHFQSSKEPLL